MQYTVYTKPNCPFCTQAKSLLTSRGEQFMEMKIGEDIERDEVLARFPNQKTVPIIVDQYGDLVGGFTQLKERFDDDSGDPRQLLAG